MRIVKWLARTNGRSEDVGCRSGTMPAIFANSSSGWLPTPGSGSNTCQLEHMSSLLDGVGHIAVLWGRCAQIARIIARHGRHHESVTREEFAAT